MSVYSAAGFEGVWVETKNRKNLVELLTVTAACLV